MFLHLYLRRGFILLVFNPISPYSFSSKSSFLEAVLFFFIFYPIPKTLLIQQVNFWNNFFFYFLTYFLFLALGFLQIVHFLDGALFFLYCLTKRLKIQPMCK